MTEKYVVVLDKNANRIFADGGDFFILEGAIEWVKWAEEKMPENKNKYEIYKMVRTLWRN